MFSYALLSSASAAAILASLGEGEAPTHRYWRIRFTENYNNPAYTALAEVEFRQIAGLPEAVIGAVTASGSYSSSYNGPKAADGNPSTYWYGTKLGSDWWLAVDFGAGNERAIVEVWIKSSIDGSYGQQAPKHLYLEYSDDGAVWTASFFVASISAWASGDERAFSS